MKYDKKIVKTGEKNIYHNKRGTSRKNKIKAKNSLNKEQM